MEEYYSKREYNDLLKRYKSAVTKVSKLETKNRELTKKIKYLEDTFVTEPHVAEQSEL